MYIVIVIYSWHTCLIFEYVDALQIITYGTIVDIFVWLVNWKFTEFCYVNLIKESVIMKRNIQSNQCF